MRTKDLINLEAFMETLNPTYIEIYEDFIETLDPNVLQSEETTVNQQEAQ